MGKREIKKGANGKKGKREKMQKSRKEGLCK